MTLGVPVATPEKSKGQTKRYLLIAIYFVLWFVLAAVFNIYNKRALDQVQIPWIIAAIQMCIGIPYSVTLWLTSLRPTPRPDIQRLLPLAFLAAVAHACGILSMSAGTLTAAQIVKSGEPFFTAIFSAILFQEYYRWPVYAALVPVFAGVAVSSASELHFSTLAFFTAMGSNIASSLRSVYSKRELQCPHGANMQAQNLYSVLTIMAGVMLILPAMLIDGPYAIDKWTNANASNTSIVCNILLSSIAYYAYNEIAFLTLELVSSIAHGTSIHVCVGTFISPISCWEHVQTHIRPLVSDSLLSGVAHVDQMFRYGDRCAGGLALLIGKSTLWNTS